MALQEDQAAEPDPGSARCAKRSRLVIVVSRICFIAICVCWGAYLLGFQETVIIRRAKNPDTELRGLDLDGAARLPFAVAEPEGDQNGTFALGANVSAGSPKVSAGGGENAGANVSAGGVADVIPMGSDISASAGSFLARNE